MGRVWSLTLLFLGYVDQGLLDVLVCAPHS
jgi:hypothetical protein